MTFLIYVIHFNKKFKRKTYLETTIIILRARILSWTSAELTERRVG